MPSFKLTGTITDIKDTEEINSKFKKRIFFVEDQEGENTYNLELHYQDTGWLDHFSIGNLVTCDIAVRGRTWSKNGKSGVINTLQCTNIHAL